MSIHDPIVKRLPVASGWNRFSTQTAFSRSDMSLRLFKKKKKSTCVPINALRSSSILKKYPIFLWFSVMVFSRLEVEVSLVRSRAYTRWLLIPQQNRSKRQYLPAHSLSITSELSSKPISHIVLFDSSKWHFRLHDIHNSFPLLDRRGRIMWHN